MTLLLALALTSAPVDAKKPDRGPSPPAELEMVLCWDATAISAACPRTDNTLTDDGVIEQTAYHIDVIGETLVYSVFGTWDLQRGGKRLVIEWPGEYLTTTYVGTAVGDGCYAGTMSHTGGASGVWEGCFH